MGTKVRIVLYAENESHAREAAAAAFDRIQQLDEIMTDYNPESELMRLSRQAAQRPQPVSPDLFNLLERSIEYSKVSGGAFDITVGPVVALWRQARGNRQLPEPDALKRARRAIGYSHIILDGQKQTLFLRRSGMKLDLGGIGKGYAADRALAVLAACGVVSALVAAGGDIAMSAPPPDQAGWRVAIQNSDPTGAGNNQELVLRDCGVSTSGDTERFVEIAGMRYSHIVDPRTGLGMRHSASVTVIAPEATASDALATALSVLPPQKGLRLIESQNGTAAYIVERSGKSLRTYLSRRMEKYLAEWSRRTDQPGSRN